MQWVLAVLGAGCFRETCVDWAKWIDIIAYSFFAFLLSLFLTKICIKILPKLGYIDIPHGRHFHAMPTPRGGGFAIIVSFFTLTGLYVLNHYLAVGCDHLTEAFFRFTIPALIIIVIGAIDDRFELSSWLKLFCQIAAATTLYFLNGGFNTLLHWILPIWIGLPLTICWVVGIVNAFNLIDGLDGVAAGLASISSFVLVFWYSFADMGEFAVLTMIFCASCLGFLRYNFHPAKIFMGDSGSTFLGFFFAVAACSQTSRAASVAALICPLLALGVPIFDVFLAILRRSLRKIIDPKNRGIMDGDHDHLHHRLQKATGSDRAAALILYAVTAFVGSFALVIMYSRVPLPLLFFLLVLFLVFGVVRLANVELRDLFSIVAKGLKRPSKTLILVILHPMIDLGFLIVAFSISFIAIFRCNPGLSVWIVAMLPFIICLQISGIYRTYWLRAGINRYYLLICSLLTSGVIGFCAFYVLFEFGQIRLVHSLRGLLVVYVMFFLLSTVMISLERFILRYLGKFGLHNLYLRTLVPQEIVRTVLVGGGLHCHLYVNWFFARHISDNPQKIIGIIDDDIRLHSKNVNGFTVLGTTDELDELWEKYHFDAMVIVTNNLTYARCERLKVFCTGKNIRLTHFSVSEKPGAPTVKTDATRTPTQTIEQTAGQTSDNGK